MGTTIWGTVKIGYSFIGYFAALLLTLLGCTQSNGPSQNKAQQTPSIKGAAPVMKYLDVSSRPLVGTLLAITRQLDAKFIPDGGIPSTLGDGVTPAPPKFNTMHETQPIPDCSNPGHYFVPLRPAAALAWMALQAACTANIDAGITGACVQIAAAPALVSSVSPGVSQVCWWEEAGSSSAPPDDYDGGVCSLDASCDGGTDSGTDGGVDGGVDGGTDGSCGRQLSGSQKCLFSDDFNTLNYTTAPTDGGPVQDSTANWEIFPYDCAQQSNVSVDGGWLQLSAGYLGDAGAASQACPSSASIGSTVNNKGYTLAAVILNPKYSCNPCTISIKAQLPPSFVCEWPSLSHYGQNCQGPRGTDTPGCAAGSTWANGSTEVENFEWLNTNGGRTPDIKFWGSFYFLSPYWAGGFTNTNMAGETHEFTTVVNSSKMTFLIDGIPVYGDAGAPGTNVQGNGDINFSSPYTDTLNSELVMNVVTANCTSHGAPVTLGILGVDHEYRWCTAGGDGGCVAP